jgi:hypothetical protein
MRLSQSRMPRSSRHDAYPRATRRRQALRRALIGALLGSCAPFALAAGPGLARAEDPSARLARTLVATDTAHLHRAPNAGEEILETGRATGTLPGSIRAYLNVGPIVKISFTISTTTGSISGTGSGRLKGRPAEPSFDGRMTVDHGTGRFTHARGEGDFYGTLNRKTYAAVVQTAGTLHY